MHGHGTLMWDKSNWLHLNINPTYHSIETFQGIVTAKLISILSIHKQVSCLYIYEIEDIISLLLTYCLNKTRFLYNILA